MRKKIEKLIDVKSFVTLALTFTFVILSLNGKISSDQFLTVFTTVIAFYFGVQYQKNDYTSEDTEKPKIIDKYSKKDYNKNTNKIPEDSENGIHNNKK